MATPEESTSFSKLPVEVRSLIYQDVLDDIIRPPLHPWDRLPKPRDYLSLLLVNREIHAEVSDIFRKLYAEKFILYFDDLLDIHWIWKNMERWPVLRDVRFWSQALLEDTEDDGDHKTDGTLMLIDRLAEWKEEWDACPGWFRTESTDWQDITRQRQWNPEVDGFKRTTISHAKCADQGSRCVPFRKLIFPIMENGCRVTTYRWRFDGPLDDHEVEPGELFPTDSGCMVLEGRLDALTFEGVPVKTVRRRMEHWRQKQAEGREDEECTEDCGCFPIPCPRDDEIPD